MVRGAARAAHRVVPAPGVDAKIFGGHESVCRIWFVIGSKGTDGVEGGKRKATNLYERRKRILEETRRIIAEQGIGAFSMNDFGQRAGVAECTLYNAFQTRERVVVAAIQEYFDEYVSRISYQYPVGTMLHSLDRMISVVQRNQKIRNYIRAILPPAMRSNSFTATLANPMMRSGARAAFIASKAKRQ